MKLFNSPSENCLTQYTYYINLKCYIDNEKTHTQENAYEESTKEATPVDDRPYTYMDIIFKI